MATPQSTGSQDDLGEGKKLEQITFRFCSECSNMLYPKEDEDAHKLQFTCRTCQYTEEAASTCVFRNVLNNSAGETAGVTQDVGSDPTVSQALSLCAACATVILCAHCAMPAEFVEYIVPKHARVAVQDDADKCTAPVMAADVNDALTVNDDPTETDEGHDSDESAFSSSTSSYVTNPSTECNSTSACANNDVDATDKVFPGPYDEFDAAKAIASESFSWANFFGDMTLLV
ncbi:DNA-directed RNA polymerase subunit [Purpureocillium lavendulum]|uniref:DNA-directed RNA polymerase subunit n=1 Tax=Purpureocillium lavendulum TaxID=1247861 RepID=A0AB34G6M4_9HYPO|nr:DNA-directed RNA polymerase subunit [Purpureocillium lavendulum]